MGKKMSLEDKKINEVKKDNLFFGFIIIFIPLDKSHQIHDPMQHT